MKKIVVKRRKAWNSPMTKALNAAAFEASREAIKKAMDANIPVSYIEDGKVCKRLSDKRMP